MKTLAELPVTDKDKAAIEEAKRLLMEKFPVDRVILFGSKARGDDDEESDIDLLVLTSRPILWRERHDMSDVLFDLELERDVLFSIYVMDSESWTGEPQIALPIHDEIDREGIVLS